MWYVFDRNQGENKGTSCWNIYEMQDSMDIESMLIICPFNITALCRIVLTL